jgi:hypothetical protein
LRKTLTAALAWLSVLITPVVTAVEVPTLFTADVPFDSKADDPRATAYRAALVEVLVRVSGAELAYDELLVDELFPSPSSYVVQFRPGAEESLWVSFDGEAIERTLRAAGQTVWGSNRPLTLVWLAVDWGEGEREIIAADDPELSPDEARSIDRNRLLRERLLEFAERRGLPIAFPLLDSEDLQRVSFSDIWGGFDELLLEASGRYDVNSVLIGRVRPESSQRNRWSYYFGDQERGWNGEPESVLAQVAELLAYEFAIQGDAPLRTVELTVAGIVSVEHFGAVQKLLSDVVVIDNHAIRRIEGDSIVYDVTAHGGAERLRRALRFSGLVEQESTVEDDFGFIEDVSTSALVFFYSP